MTKSDREKYEALMIDLRAVLRQHNASVWANGDEAELVLDIDDTNDYAFAGSSRLRGDSYPDIS